MALRRVGDWNKVGLLIHSLQKEMKYSADLSLKRFGLKLEAVAKGHISRQDLPWKPLKAATIASKVRRGFSENILVETSTYFQSITSWVKEDTVMVGVRRQAKSKDGVLLSNIAAVHEFGSKSGQLPARPLWKPSFDETLAWHTANNRPEKIFLDRIKRYY